MPDKTLLKILAISSFITGGILGVLALIPRLIGFVFLIEMFLVSPFIIVYIHKLKLVANLELQKYLSIGAISGFIGFIGFSLIYFPIACIIHLIFKVESYIWIKAMFSNISFLIQIVLFTALLSGLVNMFSSFITYHSKKYYNMFGGK